MINPPFEIRQAPIVIKRLHNPASGTTPGTASFIFSGETAEQIRRAHYGTGFTTGDFYPGNARTLAAIREAVYAYMRENYPPYTAIQVIGTAQIPTPGKPPREIVHLWFDFIDSND